MTVVRVRGLLVAVLLAVQTVACGGGGASHVHDPSYAALVEPGKSEPADDVERSILAKLATLEAGVETTVDGVVVVAEAPYAAASGRTCRSVRIRPADGAGDARTRLACELDGAWSFVPEVFQPVGAAR